MYYERVSNRDASELELEQQLRGEDVFAHPHAATVLIFERKGGELDLAALRARVNNRLDRLPRYRQRVMRVPLEGGLIWVDDEHFNTAYHIHHVRLLRRGDERELKRVVARALSQKLDPTKPLWELRVIEGLSERRFAVLLKLHPALVDDSGADLLSVLLEPQPATSVPALARFAPRPLPDPVRLIGAELLGRIPTPFSLARSVSNAVRPTSWIEQARDLLGLGEGEATPLSAPVGPHRAVDWVSLDGDALRATASRLEVDPLAVVLTLLSAAVKRLFELDPAVDASLAGRLKVGLTLPVEGEIGVLEARRLALPLDVDDARRRLERVQVELRKVVESGQPRAGIEAPEVGPWTASGRVSLAARMANGERGFQLAASFAQGPDPALYLGDARLLRAHPMPALSPTRTLSFGWIESAGTVSFGFTADWSLADRLPLLADAFVAAFDTLRRSPTRPVKAKGKGAPKPEAPPATA